MTYIDDKPIKTIADYDALAPHYLALGMDTVSWPYKQDYSELLPFVTEVISGGSRRLDIDTSIRLIATIPCGLKVSFHFEIEDADANGQGDYRIDAAGLTALFIALPEAAKAQLREKFAADAEVVEKKGREWMNMAKRQMGDAALLRSLAVQS